MSESFAIPELTRGLRAFAAPGSLGGAHDRFFLALLDARRAARAASTWSARVSAFDADRLDALMHTALRSFASEQFPQSAPDQRALFAQLEDACQEMFDAIVQLGRAAPAVRDAADDRARAAPWSAWIAALRHVFQSADRGWERVSAIASGEPPPDRRARPRRRAAREGNS